MPPVRKCLAALLFYITALSPAVGGLQQNELPKQTTVITDATKSEDVHLNLEIADDAQRKFTIKEILNGEAAFQPMPVPIVTKGFTRSSVWLKFSYKMAARKQWVLELEWPHLEYLDYFVYENKKLISQKMTGYMRDPTARDYMNRNFILDMPDSGERIFTVYLRFECQVPMTFPLAVRTLGDSFLKNAGEKMFYGFVFGVIGIMLLYNFFLFLILRDINYLNYIGFSICFGAYCVGVSGYLREFFPNSPKFNLYAVPVSVGMIWLSNFWFVRTFLELKERGRYLYWVYNAGIFLVLFGLLPGTFIDPFITDALLDIFSILSGLLLLFSSGYVWLRGHRAARYIFLAFLPWVSGATLIILRNWDILPNNFFTTHSLQMGSLLELSLFSLALADRINIIKAEREKAQLEALASETKAVESLKKADAIKDTFLAHTSHELRTPLQGILGLTEGLLTKTLDAAAHEDANLIIQSARRLSHLVNDILDYSRLKERELVLNFTDIDLGVQVNKVVRSLEYISRSKSVAVINEIPVNSCFVRADEQRLQQILFNLIGNALKFTTKGKISVQAGAQGDLVEVGVVDSGMGIPRDKHIEIFEKFGRIDEGAASGTGIGLTITKSLVELHGGQIRVESTVGIGSTFSFTLQPAQALSRLPDTDSPAAIAPRVKDTVNPGSGYVLLVEDDPIILLSTAEHLRRRGYEVATAHTGTAACELIAASPTPALAILDLMLPDISGLALCREIRNRYSGRELPILMLTARSQFQDFLSAANAGANDYLTKPFETGDLFLRIDNLLSLARLRQNLEITESKYLRRVYEDMHDHLGGVLTDISIVSANLRGDELIDKVAVEELQRQSALALKMLRDRLQIMADHQNMANDFFGSLHEQVLRRYGNAQRTLTFSFAPQNFAHPNIEQDTFLRQEIFLLVSEIATNDLKYGKGKSSWLWSTTPETLTLRFTAQSEYDPARHRTGFGTATISSRVANLGGTLEFELRASEFRLTMSLPKRAA